MISGVPLLRVWQEPTSQPSFSTEVSVVNVLATVRDKDGRIVRDLSREDFTVVEDGRQQTIRYFSRQTDLPLVVGLLVDTSLSERNMLATERDATHTFLKQVLRPDKDQAFLIHFDHEVELLQDVTSSRERLEKALALLESSPPGLRHRQDTTTLADRFGQAVEAAGRVLRAGEAEVPGDGAAEDALVMAERLSTMRCISPPTRS